jgi:tetratricopeptide (TPR) repeat protein
MSQKKTININCPSCSTAFYMDVYDSLNVQVSPELKQELVKGNFNIQKCPKCDKKILYNDYMLYHDMEKGIIIHCFVPEERENIKEHVKTIYSNLIKFELEKQMPCKLLFGLDRLVKIVLLLDSKQNFEEIRNRLEGVEDKIVYGLMFDMAEEWLKLNEQKDFAGQYKSAQEPYLKGVERWQNVQKAVNNIKEKLDKNSDLEEQEKLKQDFDREIESLRSALSDFKEAVNTCPYFLDAHRHMAWILDTLGESEKGEEHFERCFEIRPNDASIAAALAQINLRKKINNKAMHFFMLTAIFAPQDMNTRFNLGLGFEYQGDRENAVRELEYAENLADTEKSSEYIRKQIDRITKGKTEN